VVFFWSGWIVISRLGVTNSLTVYDLTGLRHGIGAVVALPYIIWSRAWRGLTPLRTFILTATAGVPYALLAWRGVPERLSAHIHHPLRLDLDRAAESILSNCRPGHNPDRRHSGRL
jgi:hypothetical protein